MDWYDSHERTITEDHPRHAIIRLFVIVVTIAIDCRRTGPRRAVAT